MARFSVYDDGCMEEDGVFLEASVMTFVMVAAGIMVMQESSAPHHHGDGTSSAPTIICFRPQEEYVMKY
jgi:hypothetical protein